MIMDSLPSMVIFLFTLFSFVSTSTAQLLYKEHCSSIVPDSPTKSLILPNSFPLGDYHTGYFTGGGDKIIDVDPSSSWNIYTFNLQRGIYETESSGLYKIEGTVTFRVPSNTFFYRHVERGNDSMSFVNGHYHRHHYYRRDHVEFSLGGFWSESSGKVCMVGTGHGYSKKGDTLNLDVVFKLNGVFKESNLSSLISGSLESLSSEKGDDGNYFEPFSVLMFPKANYNYTLDSIAAENECSYGGDSEKGLPIGNSLSFCSYPLSRVIKRLGLEYSSDCNSSSKNCTPISGKFPSLMNLRGIECSSSEKHRFRVLLRFMNNSYYEYNQVFNPETMLVGEGWWDEKKNWLCVVACHVMGNASSSSHRVGDCSVRLRLRFPSIWSINSTSETVGQIWSNKAVNDSGYFKRITFRSQLNGRVKGVEGMTYEYSMLDRVKKSCRTLGAAKNKGRRYPDAYSNDMRFDMSIWESSKRLAWGYSAPLSVNGYVSGSAWPMDSNVIVHNDENLFNMSYKIIFWYNSTLVDRNSLFNLSSARVKITAEGIYDAKTGTLCMVGCRDLVSRDGLPTAHSVDCEILVKFQCASLDSKSGSYIKGRIESTRNKSSDPLYFNPLDLSSAAFYTEAAERAGWRMDMEVTMVLISTTLACLFVGLQLYHVKKHPNVLPFISLTMMSILTLGYMIPLVLNLEALLSQNPNNKNFVLGNVGWLEVNEISIRLITMVAFLLQFRLLQLTWSSRNTNENNNNNNHLWSAEKKAAYVTFPLYAAGLLIALLFNLKNYDDKSSPMFTSNYNQKHPSAWKNFKSYGGLVFDGFLLPQIILNLFSNMRDNVLSYSFYFGTTFVRFLPHAYDIYRAHNYAQQDNVSYYYADPSADFYSTAWDIVIPLGGILFAIVIYMQQRFGPHCILPRRFKGSKVYEKVPVVIDIEDTTNM